MNVVAILASHNRCARTLECLTSYFAQDCGTTVDLSAVLVDDGSTDGTAEFVRERFSEIAIISGNGNLFWAGAMALAAEAALRQDPDYLLWLNDDVILDRDALGRLIVTSEHEPGGCIAVGALRDPITGSLTYSGVRRRGLHPLRMDHVVPAHAPVAVETFNGNVVLVPRAVSRTIGTPDGDFVHAAADFDYGLRAGKAGFLNLLASGTVGTCASNLTRTAWLDLSIPPKQRLRRLLGPKGAPPRARARYLMRHGGPAWFLFWLAPYIRAVPLILRRVRSKRRP